MFGFLNINKPSGITSHEVISILRKVLGIKQIGHAGTLDPLASGVLPVAIGKATKLIDYLAPDKAYIVEMEFGKISDTFDIEGKIEPTNFGKVSIEQIKDALSFQIGTVKQIPPAYSAVHYNGKKLYELARKGIIPDDIPSREIQIYKNELLDFDYENQILKLYVSCSKGTYIRTIVNDMGQYVNAGAVMTKLTRVCSCNLSIENSISVDRGTSKEFVQAHLIQPKLLLDLPIVELQENIFKKVLNGNKFECSQESGEFLLSYQDKIVALASSDGRFIQPKKVLL